MTRGFLSSVRMAAFMKRGRAIESSVEVDERVVAGVACLPEPPLPCFRRAECLAGHLPVQQVGLLELVSIRLHADVLVLPAYALDLAQGRVQLVVVKIVQGVEGVHVVEML